jgi:hypothetical protein
VGLVYEDWLGFHFLSRCKLKSFSKKEFTRDSDCNRNILLRSCMKTDRKGSETHLLTVDEGG